MAEGSSVKVGGTVRNTLKRGGTEKNGEETKILKRRKQAESRDGCLKKEERERGGRGRGAGALLQTKADLPQLVYEEICLKFYFKIHSSFLGRTQTNS